MMKNSFFLRFGGQKVQFDPRSIFRSIFVALTLIITNEKVVVGQTLKSSAVVFTASFGLSPLESVCGLNISPDLVAHGHGTPGLEGAPAASGRVEAHDAH